MSSMNYQKVYMNQIHSSSLLCQLSHMWKSQMLCDAIIKTGQIITKAHRVVLVAACPMLQSMENASAGSHLEVRLAADIKQESVNTFLQYLYEGFMMLTEDNVRDVEKVARLLQVDSVIKCCADFYKCMNAKTGAPFPGSAYKYSFSGHDLAEFRHVRATGLQKTASERIIKRVSDFPRPGSPGNKRPRLHRGASPSDVTVIGSDKADDTASMSHSYMTGAPDPWDRVPKLGSGMGRQGATGKNSQPGVIEIVEESIELVQTEPPEKDSGQPSSSRSSQKSAAVSIAVTSQFNTEPDISVVNVFGAPETQSASAGTASANTITSSSSSRGSITVSPLTIFQDPHPPSSSAPEPPSSSAVDSSSGQDQQQRLPEMQFSGFSQRQDMDSVYSAGKQQKNTDSQLTSTPQQRPFPVSVSPINQPKPFAAGSAMQAGISSPSSMSLPLGSPSSSKSVQKPRSAPASPAERARDNRRASEATGMQSTADMTPDLSIVKIEASNHETGGLDMHVDMPEEGVMRIHQGRLPEEQEDTSDKEIEDWAREEMSNEGSNVSGDQNNSWYMGTFKEDPWVASSVSGSPFPASPSWRSSSHVGTLPTRLAIHKLIPITGPINRKLCVYCQLNKTKTKSGWLVYSRCKCEACDVALCKRERGCFKLYHDLIFGGVNEANESQTGVGSNVNLKQFIVKPHSGVTMSQANVSSSVLSNTAPYSKYALSHHVASLSQSNLSSTNQNVSSTHPNNSHVLVCPTSPKREYHQLPSSSVDSTMSTGHSRPDFEEPLALTMSAHVTANSGPVTASTGHAMPSSSHMAPSPDMVTENSDNMAADSGQDIIISSQETSDTDHVSESTAQVTGSSDHVTGNASYAYGSVVFPTRSFMHDRTEEG
ncbi:uncharacterized protein LOC132565629 isoform X3 [Ylistrum balloti]|uniref:uncharacterized protein LOC132565629 isoform X3 n=1 Tax=Ylistrum balloti TaxID=509963 RepID=UPI0029059A8F|nr:uncharacterized protein LOC132565629 isoform X3 [Ylistrum balloti]